MSANAKTAAPTGRKKLAQGKERSDAALSHDSSNTSSPEGAKEGGWPVISLGELAADEQNSITDGPFGSKLKTEHYTSAGPRVVRLKNIGDSEFIDAKAHISEAHFATLQKHRVFPGDVVIAALGENPPRSCIVPESLGPAIVKADCIRFKAGHRILPKFINYALNAPDLRQHAKGIIHGVGRPRLNLGEIKALPIPVPPVSEQRRIVAEIEKQFTRLEAGVAALRRVQANLKRYRAAVLKAACEGKLVPTEHELSKSEVRIKKDEAKSPKSRASTSSFLTPTSSFYESGEALLQRILAERRKNWTGRGQYKEPAAPDTANLPPLPEGWTWATLEQLCPLFADSAHRTPKYGDRGVPALGPRDVVGGKLDLENARLVNDEEFAIQTARHVPQAGDIVYSRELSLGWGALVPEGRRLCLSQGMCVFRPHRDVNTRYFLALLNGPVGRKHAEAAATGSAHPHINLGDIKGYAFPLPPLAEQTRIVAEVERRLSVVEELESVVSANLQRATRLRESILQKAFTGELI